MKHGVTMIVAAAALAAGAAVGWRAGAIRGKQGCTMFLSGMVATEIHEQEAAAGEAYLKGPPEAAFWALNALLKTYARYEDAPELRPGERASRLRFASAMAHVRLANTCAKLGRTEERRRHLEEASSLSGLPDEPSLQSAVEALDKAEKKQLP